jgi:hypothetical protein
MTTAPNSVQTDVLERLKSRCREVRNARAATVRFAAQRLFDRECDELASIIEAQAKEIERLTEALRTTDAYHLTALMFRNGKTCYAALNTAALAKDDARQALTNTQLQRED